MGLDEYEKAVALMNEHPELQHFVGPRSETLVQAAEEALGLRFPPSYRRFVLELGAGGFGSFGVYGVIDANFESSSVPNGIWCTLHDRKFWGLPLDLVVVSHDGTGSYYCLDCKKSPEEGLVVLYHLGHPLDQQNKEVIANSFGEFFLQFVRETLVNHDHHSGG